MSTLGKCFACDRHLGRNPNVADTRDGQFVFVGTECYKKIKQSKEEGYQPPMGGPRLWTIKKGLNQAELAEIHPIRRT